MSAKRPMVRKQLYIQPEQNLTLREQAAKYNVSEGQIGREAIAAYLTTGSQSQQVDLNAWLEERQFIVSRQSGVKSDSKSDTTGTAEKTWRRRSSW